MSRTSTDSSSRRSDDDPPAVPSTAAEVRATLEALGVRPSRAAGQSFLVDAFVADAEAALAADDPATPVVEIGGGLGILTAALVRRGVERITVVERDRRLAVHLRATFGSRIVVQEADARTVPLPSTGAVVGNLPFSSGTAILGRLFREGPPRTVALLQKEVVDRLVAPPGSRVYGRPTIVAALFGRVEGFAVVPSEAFEPAPEVEGRLVVFERRADALPVPDVPRFEALLHALFSSRRKKLRNLVRRVVPSSSHAAAVAEVAAWPSDWPDRRPEELPPEAYFRFATALEGVRPAR